MYQTLDGMQGLNKSKKKKKVDDEAGEFWEDRLLD